MFLYLNLTRVKKMIDGDESAAMEPIHRFFCIIRQIYSTNGHFNGVSR